MEVKLNFDDAKIIKRVMDGLSSKQIEDNIVNDFLNSIREKITMNMRDRVDEVVGRITKKMSKELNQTFVKKIALEVGEKVNFKSLKKMCKADKWNSFIEETVGELFYDYLSSALEEDLVLDFNISVSGKKKATVSLCGKNSYSHRK